MTTEAAERSLLRWFTPFRLSATSIPKQNNKTVWISNDNESEPTPVRAAKILLLSMLLCVVVVAWSLLSSQTPKKTDDSSQKKRKDRLCSPSAQPTL